MTSPYGSARRRRIEVCTFCFCNALSIGHGDLVGAGRCATPLNLATSISTPRVTIADVLDTKLRQPLALRELGPAIAVVKIADPEVAEAVELRADLTELAADLVVMHSLVLTWHRERLRDADAVVARAMRQHAGLVDVAELIDLAFLDRVLRLEHLRWGDAIRRAALISGAPPRGPAIGLAASDCGSRDHRDRASSTTTVVECVRLQAGPEGPALPCRYFLSIWAKTSLPRGRVHAGGHARVNRDLHEDLADLLARHAVRQGAGDMQTQFVRAVQAARSSPG